MEDPFITSTFAGFAQEKEVITKEALGDLGDEAPLTIRSKINDLIHSSAMIDSGCSTQFIDEEYARFLNLPLRPRPRPKQLVLFDGQPSGAGAITHQTTVKFQLGSHTETLVFNVTRLGGYKTVLGKSWLRLHNPDIDWHKNSISIRSSYCHQHCLPQPDSRVQLDADPTAPISTISAFAFNALITDTPSQLYAVSIKELERAISKKALTMEEEIEELSHKVPSDYHQFLPMFAKNEADKKLPPHRYVDHEINLIEGAKPPFGPLYSMSLLELRALKDYLEENLSKGYIRASSSSAASPVLFARKPDGGIRFCVDYRALNDLTVKNRYPLPLIDESLQRLQGAKKFTRLDLRGYYNLIRIKEGDEWKTAFRTRYGLFEYLVMPFGLTNAPATGQQFINDILREYLDVFVVVYLDDILIYSQKEEDHVEHVTKVLQKLQEAGLFVNGQKCDFHTTSTTYLGFIVTPEGISMDPQKVQAISDWEPPKNVHDVQVFLGFANFYRRFIDKYAIKCRPMYDLLKKDVPFNWTNEHQRIFEELKEAFSTAPILRHYDPSLQAIVECDASNTVVGGILSQYFPENGKQILHPVAYFSKKMSPAECNYGIGDKELLAIVLCFKEWHHFLEGTQHPVLVYSDHSNLQKFRTTKILSGREIRWSTQLSKYDFKIQYRPGPLNTKADALTRRSDDLPKEGDGRGPVEGVLLNDELFETPFLDPPTTAFAVYPGFIDPIRNALADDAFGQSIIKALERNDTRHPRVPLAETKFENNLLYVYGLLYIPNDDEIRAKIIKRSHDHPAAGHPGRAATFEMVTRDYWWPSIRQTIARYVDNCDTCTRIKPARHKPYGYLRPLEIPQRRWDSISMDFVTGLPLSQGFDSILVVVDRLTKMAHYIPTTEDGCDAVTTARLFLANIFKLHGTPTYTISDRGSVFTSGFFREFARLLKIEPRFSTAYHPQTDGQTERINAIMEQYLRGYCNYQQDDWVELLPLAEFAYNNTISSTTGMTPFFANYGYNPQMDLIAAPGQPPLPPEVLDIRDRMTKLDQHLQAESKYAQSLQAEYADKSRSPPPVFKVGDLVWLNRRNFHTTRPSNKLDYKRVGKFKVVKKVGSHAYKLELPPTFANRHPTYHVSLLEPVATNPLPGQVQPPPHPTIVQGEEQFPIEAIVDSRIYRRQPQYLVKWVGYDDPTWEPPKHVRDAPLLVREFHHRYPNKPRHELPPPSYLDDSDSEDELA